MFITRLARMACIAAFMLTLPPSTSLAQAWRVNTDVFAGEEAEPAIQTITIFKHDVIYDFLVGQNQEEEITVFDLKRGRLVLLDPARQVRTTLTKEGLMQFTAQMKAFLQQQDKQEIAEPKFELQFDTETKWVTLTNDSLEYRFVGERPKQDTAVKQFHAFADWYARLNAMRPGNVPPFARLRVNSELAEREWLPREIERTVKVKRLLKESRHTVRSRHQAMWSLSRSDHQRIDRAGTAMATYRPIRFTEYVGLDEATAGD